MTGAVCYLRAVQDIFRELQLCSYKKHKLHFQCNPPTAQFMPTIPSGMQWIMARLLQAPVTLLETLCRTSWSTQALGAGKGISSLLSQLRAGIVPGLWCRLLAVTSTRPGLGVLERGMRWHTEALRVQGQF